MSGNGIPFLLSAHTRYYIEKSMHIEWFIVEWPSMLYL